MLVSRGLVFGGDLYLGMQKEFKYIEAENVPPEFVHWSFLSRLC